MEHTPPGALPQVGMVQRLWRSPETHSRPGACEKSAGRCYAAFGTPAKWMKSISFIYPIRSPDAQTNSEELCQALPTSRGCHRRTAFCYAEASARMQTRYSHTKSSRKKSRRWLQRQLANAGSGIGYRLHKLQGATARSTAQARRMSKAFRANTTNSYARLTWASCVCPQSYAALGTPARWMESTSPPLAGLVPRRERVFSA